MPMEAPFEDSDFEYFTEGIEAKVKCKHCGLIMVAPDAADLKAHQKICPEKSW